MRKKLQGVVAENLLADAAGVLFEQIAPVHLFSQYLSETAAGEFRRPVNSLGVIAVGTPDEKVRELALADEKIKAAIAGKQIVRVIIVPNKLVNIVVK